MVKKLLLGFVILVALFFLAASFQPNQFVFARSVSIKAPPKVCFALVNNFHNWEKWSVWAKMDPGMQTAYDGPVSGVGAIYGWDGNGKVGSGKMTLIKSIPSSLIDIQLQFLKPMTGTDLTEFTFERQGKETKVTWTMSGPLNLAEKAFHMVCDTDKMLAPDFEKGLAQLKAAAEASQK